MRTSGEQHGLYSVFEDVETNRVVRPKTDERQQRCAMTLRSRPELTEKEDRNALSFNTHRLSVLVTKIF